MIESIHAEKEADYIIFAQKRPVDCIFAICPSQGFIAVGRKKPRSNSSGSPLYYLWPMEGMENPSGWPLYTWPNEQYSFRRKTGERSMLPLQLRAEWELARILKSHDYKIWWDRRREYALHTFGLPTIYSLGARRNAFSLLIGGEEA